MQSRSSNVQRRMHPKVHGHLRSAPGICACCGALPRTLPMPQPPSARTANATVLALAHASARGPQVGFCSGKRAWRPLVAHAPPCRLSSLDAISAASWARRRTGAGPPAPPSRSGRAAISARERQPYTVGCAAGSRFCAVRCGQWRSCEALLLGWTHTQAHARTPSASH